MFQGQQRQNYGGGNSSGPNASTSFHIFYSESAMTKVSGWNKNLSINVAPCTGVDAEGRRQYVDDMNQQVKTALTIDNCIALKKDIEDHLLDSIKAGTADASSVEIGDGANKKIFTIGFDGESTYLKISTNVTPEGICGADNEIMTKFGKKAVRRNYSGETGGELTYVESDFEIFYTILTRVSEFIPVSIHVSRYDAEVKKMYSNRNGGGYGGQQNYGNNNNGGYQAPVSNYGGSMEDFLPFH